MCGLSRVAARVTALVVLAASALAFGCAAPLAAEPADDSLAAARSTLSAARAMLLGHLAAAKTHSDDAYDVVYRLNAAAEALDGERASACHLGDEDILRAPFRLADAQELVARHAGFDEWQVLTSGATL